MQDHTLRKNILKLKQVERWTSRTKIKRARPYSMKVIAAKLGVSFFRCQRVLATPEAIAKAKANQKTWREKRLANPLVRLEAKIVSFAKRAPYPVEITPEQVIERFGTSPTCYLTGAPIDYADSKTYSLDHFVPVSKGGESTLDNMRLASQAANYAKRDLSFDDFVSLCRAIVARYPLTVATDENLF